MNTKSVFVHSKVFFSNCNRNDTHCNANDGIKPVDTVLNERRNLEYMPSNRLHYAKSVNKLCSPYKIQLLCVAYEICKWLNNKAIAITIVQQTVYRQCKRTIGRKRLSFTPKFFHWPEFNTFSCQII